MLYFSRLSFSVLFFLVSVMGSMPALAAFPATADATVCTVAPCYEYRLASSRPYFTTRNASADDQISAYQASNGSNYRFRIDSITQTGGSGYGILFYSSSYLNGAWTANEIWFARRDAPASAPVYSCPANSTLSGSSCTCTAPNVQNSTNDGCSAPPDPDIAACQNASVVANSTLGVPYQDVILEGAVSSGTSICVPTPGTSSPSSVGCTVNFNAYIRTTDAAGNSYSSGTIDTQGGYQTLPCSLTTTDATKPPKADSTKCPAGQQMGQINGVDSCQPYGSGTTTTTAKTGTESSTDSTGTTEVQKDSVTVCVSGKCTTTQTTTTTKTPSDSSPPTTSTSSTVKTESKAEFCRSNPTSSECDSTGADGENDGMCRPGDKSVGCSELGDIPSPDAVGNVNKSVVFTQDSGWGAANGTCPAPRVLNLHFGTVEMPWTLICDFATGIRPLILAFAYLSAALIFFGMSRKN